MFKWLRNLSGGQQDVETRLDRIEQDMADLKAMLGPTLDTLVSVVRDHNVAITSLQETHIRQLQLLESMNERLNRLALPAANSETKREER